LAYDLGRSDLLDEGGGSVIARRLCVIGVVVVVSAVLAATAGLGATQLAPRKPCGQISGPDWTYLKGGLSGSKYVVVAIGSFTCKSAKTWVAKLAKDHVTSHANKFNPNVLKNGPRGYRCAASTSKQEKAFAGECDKGPVSSPTSEFSWAGVP
jgi:hypothetical protein